MGDELSHQGRASVTRLQTWSASEEEQQRCLHVAVQVFQTVDKESRGVALAAHVLPIGT